jgi:alkylated DNA repair dioxygenase AlkB
MTELPAGMVFQPDFLSFEEESGLLAQIQTLEWRSFQMKGVTAKRRIVHFGWHYSFESYRLTEAEPIPPLFEPSRTRAAALAGIDPSEFAEALVTEYQPGAGIGWHRDAPPLESSRAYRLPARAACAFKRAKERTERFPQSNSHHAPSTC